MRRWFTVLALLPQCAGCLYYAYPTVSHTPELAVENRDGNVHAFRVDIDRTERNTAASTVQYSLAKIPIDGRGVIPSQLEVAPASGVLNPLGLLESVDGHERSQYTMVIRLYKPGSRTVEVKAWEKSRAVQWSPAPSLADQEKAIDDLIAVPGSTESPDQVTWWQLKDEKAPGFGLQPGTISPEQRRAIQFASSEYARLAHSPLASAPNLQPARERLQQKAIWLKRLAEQGQ